MAGTRGSLEHGTFSFGDSMKLDRSFWKDRRVFLTGHTGFKGSWLSLWLSTLGAKVVGYALDPPTSPSLYEQADVASVLHSIIGDIRDLPRLSAAIAEFEPEVVLHLAAQSVVRHGLRKSSRHLRVKRNGHSARA